MDQLCRICLQSGGEVPIFQEKKKLETSMKTKFLACFQEEVQELEGYPNSICETCNDTLDNIIKFIQTYRENQRWFEEEAERKSKLSIQKHKEFATQESEDQVYLDNADADSESDFTLAHIKKEFGLSSIQGDYIKIEIKPDPSMLKKPIKKVKKEPKARKRKRNEDAPCEVEEDKGDQLCGKAVVHKVNPIATSLLEGVFHFTGMQWRYRDKVSGELERCGSRRDNTKRHRMMLPKQPRKKHTSRVNKDPRKLCDLCGTVFPNQHKLTKHRQKEHFREMLKCDFAGCKKVCRGARNLTLHKTRKHSSERHFVCSECGKTFSMLRDLKKHNMAVHTRTLKKKIYACSMCERVFACQQSVDIHERSVHTGIRPAVCSVCDGRFFHETYLKEHMRLHTGETPYKCPVCGRGYAQRSNMKSHLKSHRLHDLDDDARARLTPNYLRLLKSYQ